MSLRIVYIRTVRILRIVTVVILLVLVAGTFVGAGVQIKAGAVGEWGTFTVTSVDCSNRFCDVVGDFKGAVYVKANIVLGNGVDENVGDELDAWYSPGEGDGGVAYRAPWRWWIAPAVTILIGLAVLVIAFETATTRLRFEAPK